MKASLLAFGQKASRSCSTTSTCRTTRASVADIGAEAAARLAGRSGTEARATGANLNHDLDLRLVLLGAVPVTLVVTVARLPLRQR